MPISSNDDFNLKLQKYQINENLAVEGIFLSNNEYALFRRIDKQIITNEFNFVKKYRPYRRTAYLREKRMVFISLEKPLFSHCDAKIFRIEKLMQGEKIEIVSHEDLQGYWINKKNYAELSSLKVSTVTRNLQLNKVEFGQIYKKDSNGYSFFIPIDPEPFSINDVYVFLLGLKLKKLAVENRKLSQLELSDKAIRLSLALAENPELVDLINSFNNTITEDQIDFMCRFAEAFTIKECEMILENSHRLKKLEEGIDTFFGSSTVSN